MNISNKDKPEGIQLGQEKGEIKSFTEMGDLLSPQLSEKNSILPLCHTTNRGAASAILLKRMATPKECLVYHEKLLYLFYGKASYLIDKELANYTDNPPVTLIYPEERIRQYLNKGCIKRILPFDSGGFPRYKFPEGFEKEQYTYENGNLIPLLGFIRLLYENHRQYLIPREDKPKLAKYKEVCLQIDEILNLYDRAFRGKIPSGDQVYSIEIQYGINLEILPSHLVISYDTYTSAYWNTTVVNSFPSIKVVPYGETEIIKGEGKVLTAGQYQDLMRAKVAEIVASYSEAENT